jgi:hypothetical protein
MIPAELRVDHPLLPVKQDPGLRVALRVIQALLERELREPEPMQPGQERVEPEQAEPEQAEPERVEPERVEPEQAELERVEPGRVARERAAPERVVQGLVELDPALEQELGPASNWRPSITVSGYFRVARGDGYRSLAARFFLLDTNRHC